MDQRHTWGINAQLPNTVADNPRTLSLSSSRSPNNPISITKNPPYPISQPFSHIIFSPFFQRALCATVGTLTSLVPARLWSI